MVKKNQLRKYKVQKIGQLSEQQTKLDTLKLYTEFIGDKNKLLIDQQSSLLQKLDQVRKQTLTTVRQLNEGVKDRIDKKEKVIMTKQNRPTLTDVKDLSDLYSEHQQTIISQSNQSIDELKQNRLQFKTNLQNKILQSDNSQYDNKYEKLKNQCAKQNQIRENLQKERDQARNHYGEMDKILVEYRIRYEQIENKIQEQQKQLDHLTTYFNSRQQQDHENIIKEQNLSHFLQKQLLKAQDLVNYHEQKNEQLGIQRQQLLSMTMKNVVK